jgi:hypothetical protein
VSGGEGGEQEKRKPLLVEVLEKRSDKMDENIIAEPIRMDLRTSLRY